MPTFLTLTIECFVTEQRDQPDYLTVGAFSKCRCLLSQLTGVSFRRSSTTLFVCRRLDRSYHAVAMSEFSRCKFSSSCSFAFCNLVCVSSVPTLGSWFDCERWWCVPLCRRTFCSIKRVSLAFSMVSLSHSSARCSLSWSSLTKAFCFLICC